MITITSSKGHYLIHQPARRPDICGDHRVLLLDLGPVLAMTVPSIQSLELDPDDALKLAEILTTWAHRDRSPHRDEAKAFEEAVMSLW